MSEWESKHDLTVTVTANPSLISDINIVVSFAYEKTESDRWFISYCQCEVHVFTQSSKTLNNGCCFRNHWSHTLKATHLEKKKEPDIKQSGRALTPKPYPVSLSKFNAVSTHDWPRSKMSWERSEVATKTVTQAHLEKHTLRRYEWGTHAKARRENTKRIPRCSAFDHTTLALLSPNPLTASGENVFPAGGKEIRETVVWCDDDGDGVCRAVVMVVVAVSGR